MYTIYNVNDPDRTPGLSSTKNGTHYTESGTHYIENAKYTENGTLHTENGAHYTENGAHYIKNATHYIEMKRISKMVHYTENGTHYTENLYWKYGNESADDDSKDKKEIWRDYVEIEGIIY